MWLLGFCLLHSIFVIHIKFELVCIAKESKEFVDWLAHQSLQRTSIPCCLQFVSQYQCIIFVSLSTAIDRIYQGLTLLCGFCKTVITWWSKDHPQSCESKRDKKGHLESYCLHADPRTELDEVLEKFKVAHEAYHSQINTERERQESERYYDSLVELASELEREISSWISQSDAQRFLSALSVGPKDSVGDAGSRDSFHT